MDWVFSVVVAAILVLLLIVLAAAFAAIVVGSRADKDMEELRERWRKGGKS